MGSSKPLFNFSFIDKFVKIVLASNEYFDITIEFGGVNYLGNLILKKLGRFGFILGMDMLS